MTSTATKFTGAQVKELLTKAVGGIYYNKRCGNVVTGIFKDYMITDDGLRVNMKNCVTINIPISDDEQYTNYAVAGEDEEFDEVWESSTYFEYKFWISGYCLNFNTTDKGTYLTWDQFKELTDSDNDSMFSITSQDTGSLYIYINDCTITVSDSEIEISSLDVNTIFDKDIITCIYNDSTEDESIIYRLEFDNGMSDIEIRLAYNIVAIYK